MAGFRKAKAEQAALKMGFYGPPGSGKTFTSLLIAEGLAKRDGKRVAVVDTERGTDFYCKDVAERQTHPAAFDFDALYTRSLTETLAAVKSLKPAEYSAVVIDSITHLWEAARAAYDGKVTGVGSIPFHAWGKIKKPYKDLIAFLLSSPLHVIFCGRQGNDFKEDEETGELKSVGYKMKAEGETPYEPHILMRMEMVKGKNGDGHVVAFAEKDRTGVLAGKCFTDPDYKTLVIPLLKLLGGTQARIATEDETGMQDADALAQQDQERERLSARHLKTFKARIALAESKADLEKVGKLITPDLKKQMLPADVDALREAYREAEQQLGPDAPRHGADPDGTDKAPLARDAVDNQSVAAPTAPAVLLSGAVSREARASVALDGETQSEPDVSGADAEPERNDLADELWAEFGGNLWERVKAKNANRKLFDAAVKKWIEKNDPTGAGKGVNTSMEARRQFLEAVDQERGLWAYLSPAK